MDTVDGWILYVGGYCRWVDIVGGWMDTVGGGWIL